MKSDLSLIDIFFKVEVLMRYNQPCILFTSFLELSLLPALGRRHPLLEAPKAESLTFKGCTISQEGIPNLDTARADKQGGLSHLMVR